MYSSPRLLLILFNSRAKLDHEQDYHSFDGKILYGRWAISRLRKYLWMHYSMGYVNVM